MYSRSDEAGQFGTSLTIAQWVSLGLFATGVAFGFGLKLRSSEKLSLIIAPPGAGESRVGSAHRETATARGPAF